MAKFFSLGLLFLLFLFFIATSEFAPEEREQLTKKVHKSALMLAHGDVQRHSITSHACSFAKSVAGNVSVCPLASMATSRFVLATMTGRPRGEDPNAPK
ncbi:hypothetical protein AMTR_s00119p00075570 [Amborella trichopoda]|uniref:BURP domain-containing protein n=1 Tax=Amborella trichopoda TaxID=13333 RepID=W1NNI1_AMBTC|nr:hypothetical protein AMTR_s00119p00075570 [Amborella trichopoda]